MLLFALWAVLVAGALAGAGYSHYRYRVRHNQYYERLFARDSEVAGAMIPHHPGRTYVLPAFTLAIVTLLVPMSLGI